MLLPLLTMMLPMFLFSSTLALWASCNCRPALMIRVNGACSLVLMLEKKCVLSSSVCLIICMAPRLRLRISNMPRIIITSNANSAAAPQRSGLFQRVESLLISVSSIFWVVALITILWAEAIWLYMESDNVV